MFVIAVANHKGGVGKTTVVRNLAQVIADQGHPILAVDCDPQGSLTRSFNITDIAHGLADVIGGDKPGWLPMTSAIQTISPTLQVCPSGIQLGDHEIAAISRLGRENLIKKALASLPRPVDSTKSPSPICLLDCAPSRGLLTINALNAAHATLIVTQSGDLEAAALLEFMQTVDNVKAELNPALETLGIVFNEYVAQGTFDAETLSAMRSADLQVIATIGRTVAIKRASTARLALSQYDKSNPRNEEYHQLAQKVLKWAKTKQNPSQVTPVAKPPKPGVPTSSLFKRTEPVTTAIGTADAQDGDANASSFASPQPLNPPAQTRRSTSAPPSSGAATRAVTRRSRTSIPSPAPAAAVSNDPVTAVGLALRQSELDELQRIADQHHASRGSLITVLARFAMRELKARRIKLSTERQKFTEAEGVS